MADSLQTINSGFYDAVNLDRLYSADQMNMPYKRVITEGVFATPEGTPSTDFQVMAADGLSVHVLEGLGLMGNRWTENENVVTFVVPANASVYTRIDSVIARVDTSVDVRAASVIYRTGVATSTPSAPALVSTDDITEYRLANISVSANATAITQANITDCRGTDECPWITGLIQQVDTGSLFVQYQDALGQTIDSLTQEFDEYKEEQRQAWHDFLETLTDDLTVTMSVIQLQHIVVTEASSITVNIGIPLYDSTTDILRVTMNGLQLVHGADYEVLDNTRIGLSEPVSEGQVVEFLVMKSVVQGDISNIQALIQELSDEVAAVSSDSGWTDLTPVTGLTAYKTPSVRRIGHCVELNGAVKGLTGAGKAICYLPANVRPSKNHVFVAPVISGSSASVVKALASVSVLHGSGVVHCTAVSGAIEAGDILYIDQTFLCD